MLYGDVSAAPVDPPLELGEDEFDEPHAAIAMLNATPPETVISRRAGTDVLAIPDLSSAARRHCGAAAVDSMIV
jgi:hypothetical protein